MWACYGAAFFEATVTNATSGVWRTSSGYNAVAQYLGLEIPYFLDWWDDYTYWVEYEATGPGGTTTERFYVTVHPDDRVDYIRSDSECAAVAG